MVLVDFMFNYVHVRYVAGMGWVRYFTSDQLYDLTLHLSMLAVASLLLFGPTSAMRLSAMRTSAVASTLFAGSITRPPRMASVVRVWLP